METQLLDLADLNRPKAITGMISVKLGDVFNIRLKENPTTGYTWIVTKLPSNLQPLNIHYTVAPHQPGIIGVGGTKTFTFKALGKSKNGENLVFAEMLPSEKEPIEELVWKIDVQGKVAYEPITDYFVAQLEDGPHYLVINSMAEFDKYFQPAGGMHKKQRWITGEDFKSHYIVAKVEPIEKMVSEYMLENLDVANEALEIKYTVKKEQISWPVRWCSLLLVEKLSYKNVVFIENGMEKAKINI